MSCDQVRYEPIYLTLDSNRSSTILPLGNTLAASPRIDGGWLSSVLLRRSEGYLWGKEPIAE